MKNNIVQTAAEAIVFSSTVSLITNIKRIKLWPIGWENSVLDNLHVAATHTTMKEIAKSP